MSEHGGDPVAWIEREQRGSSLMSEHGDAPKAWIEREQRGESADV